MTPKRYQILWGRQDRYGRQHRLHRKEIRRGWHFCWELDDLLITPTKSLIACSCLPGKRRTAKTIDKLRRKHHNQLEADLPF